ncbi:CAAX amino terminal protease family protein [Abeliophyllum distichum]|uniref:CAAX amino terminal protease family protein n=1 Tax=Abeliophyllum distichum TaxID=126358 RepID=A0ABD1U3R6_9LAMI
MDLQTTQYWSRIRHCNLHFPAAFRFFGDYFTYSCRKWDICGHHSLPKSSIRLCSGYKANVRAFASQKQKKLRRSVNIQKGKNIQPSEQLQNENDGLNVGSASENDRVQDDILMLPSDNLEVQNSVVIPSRSAVLQACTVTSCLIGALGILIRQVSHVASTEGLPIIDCSTNITFNFELSHLVLIMELVILVSSCRYLLLKTWPDFSKSSEAANRQVLTSLEPMDYIIVAFLPGVSEELLFRGALLPLLGVNWTSIFAVAALFGILHLGSGRKYSFAVWATFVGIVYGYATTLSSSVFVPMASHALNNLVGGIIWRYTLKSPKQIE